MMKSPEEGTMVQFWPGGVKGSRRPFAAVVTESGADGRVKLNLFQPGGGQMLGNQFFHRHIDDPWVQVNRQWLCGTDPGTMPRGCWDYVPGLMSVQTPQAEPQEDRKEIGRRKVADLLTEGVDPDKIASKVRFYGLSKSDVDELIGATA